MNKLHPFKSQLTYSHNCIYLNMKYTHLVIILCSILVLWACAPKPSVTPETRRAEVGDELFASAEELFESRSYNEALARFEDYYRQYPDKPLAVAALMKIGIIHALLGDYEKARSTYEQIISKYPRSSFAPDAQVEILFTYFQKRNYQVVIERGVALLERVDSRVHRLKINVLIGDAYMVMGSAIDAIDYYARAQLMATELERDTIADKLKESIAQLDSEEVAILLNRPDTDLPTDFLMFQLGLNYTMAEKYDDAITVLSEFINRYPQHENRMLAESLINEINKNAVFNRYTIGCLLPLSGPYQTFGYRALKGLELALDQFSSQSDNPPINIIVKDTGADPDKTILALEELYRDQVAAILGPIVSVDVAARKAQEMGIPIVTITQKDNIPKIGDKVFRNFITPKMQVQALTAFMIESLGLYRFAILYPDENYGTTFMNLFWDQLLESGGVVVGVEAYEPKQTDFSDPIKKLVGLYYEIPDDLKPQVVSETKTEEGVFSENPEDNPNEKATAESDEEEEPESIVDFDAIFIPDSPKKAGLLIPQLAYYDIKDVYLLGTNLWHSESLIEIADQYVQGAIMPDGFFAGSKSPRVRNFVELFENTFQETPEFIEAILYDSAMILFKVVSEPSIRFRSEIRDGLLNMNDYPGVTGMTRFDENGDVLRRLYLLRVKGKTFVELE